jgi:uncharacterized protein (TIGR02284 family)
MTHEVADVPALLNDLVEVCQDGERGYLTAAGDVGNSELASIFRHYAEQRVKFAKELRAEIVRLGATAAERGTVSGALHRGWINVKAALTGSGSGAVIAACETGEDSAAAAFEQAVDTDIPGETRGIVERQAKQIREAHSHMLRLKKEAETGAVFQKNEVKG